MLLSVVIPAFDEEEQLRETLPKINDALLTNQSDGFTWEVIVCDNNSTDQTAATALEFGATVVSEPKNQISRARNTGAAAAKGDWLLFVDADSYPNAKLIAEVKSLISDRLHIGCGSTIDVRGGTLFNKLRLERLNPLFRLLGLCGGVFLLCEREAFQNIGGFSTSLFALEEVEFVIRLKRYGRRKTKKFTVLHRHPVITSGRKGDYDPVSLLRIVVSNVVAFAFLLMAIVLPERWTPKAPKSLLSYWYGRR